MALMDSAARQMSVKILFVCMSNICRSVALQAALNHLIQKKGLSDNVFVDSCGLSFWHLGEKPDPRLMRILEKKGISLDHQAREIEESDFKEFDYIIAVTKEILRDLKNLAKKEEYQKKIYLAGDFSDSLRGEDMSDPYNAFKEDFERLVSNSEEIAKGIVEKIL